jgi:hypothetical protein
MTALTHTLPTIAPRQPAQRYQRTGDLMMSVAAVVTVLAGLVAYPYASQFSLAAQIAAHLVIPVGAGVFKLGYVVRLAAQEAQRRGRRD